AWVATVTGQPRAWPEVIQVVHLVLGAGLTLMTLMVGARRGDGPLRGVLVMGLLTSVMLMVSPVCHNHYFALNLVLVTPLVGLGLACAEAGKRNVGWVLWLSYAAIHGLQRLPGLQVLRQLGVPALGGLVLWGAGLVVARRIGRQ